MQLCCVISEPQLSVEIEQIKNMHVCKSSDGCLIRVWFSCQKVAVQQKTDCKRYLNWFEGLPLI